MYANSSTPHHQHRLNIEDARYPIDEDSDVDVAGGGGSEGEEDRRGARGSSGFSNPQHQQYDTLLWP